MFKSFHLTFREQSVGSWYSYRAQQPRADQPDIPTYFYKINGQNNNTFSPHAEIAGAFLWHELRSRLIKGKIQSLCYSSSYLSTTLLPTGETNSSHFNKMWCVRHSPPSISNVIGFETCTWMEHLGRCVHLWCRTPVRKPAESIIYSRPLQ